MLEEITVFGERSRKLGVKEGGGMGVGLRAEVGSKGYRCIEAVRIELGNLRYG